MSTRSVRRVAAATALIVSFALPACTSSTTTEGTAEYVDDVVITSKVKMAVVNAGLNPSEINVETSKGRVQLSGFVRSPADIDQAMTVARGVEGVTSVSNDMRLE